MCLLAARGGPGQEDLFRVVSGGQALPPPSPAAGSGEPNPAGPARPAGEARAGRRQAGMQAIEPKLVTRTAAPALVAEPLPEPLPQAATAAKAGPEAAAAGAQHVQILIPASAAAAAEGSGLGAGAGGRGAGEAVTEWPAAVVSGVRPAAVEASRCPMPRFLCRGVL
jgi:hypothetical protein